MVWNSGENDEVQGEVQPGLHPEVQPEVQPLVQGNSTGGVSDPVPEVEVDLSPEEIRVMEDLRRYRSRMHDVPDARFEDVLNALRERKSARSIARELVEEGYCPHLSPTTVRVYVMAVRDALGLPGYAEQSEAVEKIVGDEDLDEPIEGQPALKKLKWMTRVQQSRVRKALKMEGMMGGMVLPQASSELKLMSDLVDKELDVSLKTGEMKQAPTKVEIETPPELEGVTQAQAYRVILAYERLMKMGPEIVAAAEALPPETESE